MTMSAVWKGTVSRKPTRIRDPVCVTRSSWTSSVQLTPVVGVDLLPHAPSRLPVAYPSIFVVAPPDRTRGGRRGPEHAVACGRLSA